jgi:hypothetical protein
VTDTARVDGSGSLCQAESLVLSPGDSQSSASGRFTLVYQLDGNFVLFDGADWLWATGTEGTVPGRVVLQEDGNLVMYDAQQEAVWTSNTSGFPGANLVVQDDGNVVIYDGTGVPLWGTDTARPQ